MGKVTWLRPYIGSERAPACGREAFPGGGEPEDTTGGEVHCSICLPGVLRNCPQTLTQSPRLGVTATPGFWLCDFITATTKALSKKVVEAAQDGRQLRAY